VKFAIYAPYKTSIVVYTLPVISFSFPPPKA